MSDRKLTVGAVLYPGFELLDMFGPLEMFSMIAQDPVEILMLAEGDEPVAAAMGEAIGVGPRVAPDGRFDDAPPVDILLVPGGFGTLPELDNPAMLQFLQRAGEQAGLVCSVCTGSVLLARAGLLAGRRATSNKQFFALATMENAEVQWVEQARWVEDGKFFTSSGVSAGMDMSLAVISRLYNQETAETIAQRAEYSWHRDADADPFADQLNEAARAMGLV